jgi:TetR/AcrR family transcriptional regulator
MRAGETEYPPERAGKWDAAASRAALLRAGRAAFARDGLAGARVAAIAQDAGVSKQLLYHHFGSKDGLYRAVLEGVYAEIRAFEQELSLDDVPPDQALARLTGFSFDYLARTPDFIALLNDENGHGGLHVRQSRKLGPLHSPLVALIAAKLKAGVAAGCVRDGIDSVQLYISIAALGYFYFSNARTLSAIFGRDLTKRQHVAARRQHVVEFVLAAIGPVSPSVPWPCAARGSP